MQPFEPRPLRWTSDEYWKACKAGVFLERRVQLVGGDIIETGVTTNAEAIGISCGHDVLRQAFGASYWVRLRMTLDLRADSVVDPDLAVVPGAARSYVGKENPTTALLVVEVADATLSFDRDVKAGLYAACGIADYWILNVVDRQLEVCRDPIADAAAWLGHRYQKRTDLVAGDTVTPLALPGVTIAVDDLLP